MADSCEPPVFTHGALSMAVLEGLDQLGMAVLIKDLATGRYDHVSDSAAQVLGFQGKSAVGALDVDLFEATQVLSLRAADQQAQAAFGGLRAEHRLELQGERREFLTWRQVVALPTSGGAAGAKILAIWQDVTEARRREAQLQTALAQLEEQQRANDALRRNAEGNQLRDEVSGLYQRVHFEEQLRREADLSSREQREFALVSVAIDNLEEIRKLHGGEGCERVIEALGRLLRANTRAMDSPCRLGGDRFVVLLSGVGLSTAHSRMEQLRRQCTTHIVAHNGQQIPFTVCMGVASFPHTAGTIEDLMRSADRAMATARETGNRIVLASIQFVPAH